MNIIRTKICDICKRPFQTLFESKLHCSIQCNNEKSKVYQRTRSQRLKDLQKENEDLKRRIRLLREK